MVLALRGTERWFVRSGRKLLHRVTVAIAVVLVFAGAVGVAVTVSAAHLSESQGPTARPTTPQGPSATSIAKLRASLASAVTFAPSPGATSVAPDNPIVVKAQTGRISTVHVTSSGGAAVAGMLSTAGDTWQSSGSLAYGTDYHVAATVSDVTAGTLVSSDSTSTFRTLTPTAGVTTDVFPSDGLTIGVGQPVVFRFNQGITDSAARATLLTHLSVTESRPVVGGWHWYSDQELHFRPEKFWPTGDHVTVTWNLTGWNAGGGAWGNDVGTTRFSIGHARISYADLSTHVMTVTDNGRTVAKYPISGGKPTDPTMAGVHLVLDRSTVVHMVSSTNGIPVNSPDGYDELVYFDVHISDTGEYVHAAPWSVSSQGHTNVSHGCINLSPANAQAFFGFSRVGDVILVTGSPRPPVRGDHGVMDWDTTWSGFTPANVIVHGPDGL
jgi:lipoprotein-anchoring transpeptidase ErfK/SrfK